MFLPRNGTKRLKISAFLRLPSEKRSSFQGIAQEMTSIFDLQFGWQVMNIFLLTLANYKNEETDHRVKREKKSYTKA